MKTFCMCSKICSLSQPKLHPILRIKHAEKDWFTTQQKNYFLGYLMTVFLDNVKEIVFWALCKTRVTRWGDFIFYGALGARGLAHSTYLKWSLTRNHTNSINWRYILLLFKASRRSPNVPRHQMDGSQVAHERQHNKAATTIGLWSTSCSIVRVSAAAQDITLSPIITLRLVSAPALVPIVPL